MFYLLKYISTQFFVFLSHVTTLLSLEAVVEGFPGTKWNVILPTVYFFFVSKIKFPKKSFAHLR